MTGLLAAVAAVCLAFGAGSAAAEPLKIRAGWVNTPATMSPLLFQKRDILKHYGKTYVVEPISFRARPRFSRRYTPANSRLARFPLPTSAPVSSSRASRISASSPTATRAVSTAMLRSISMSATTAASVRLPIFAARCSRPMASAAPRTSACAPCSIATACKTSATLRSSRRRFPHLANRCSKARSHSRRYRRRSATIRRSRLEPASCSPSTTG